MPLKTCARRGGAFLASLCFACGLLMACTAATSVADDSGDLQLNTDIITNKGVGIGDSGDFPVRSQLFTDALNQIASENVQHRSQLVGSRKTLDFSRTTTNSVYAVDTAKADEELFVDYHPQIVVGEAHQQENRSSAWYWIIGLATFPLAAGAALLGRRTAARNVRRNRERHTR